MQKILPRPAKNYALKTWQRINEVKESLQHYHESQALLKAFAEKRYTLHAKGYTDKAECYRRTARDEARTARTLTHLAERIALLQHELAVLQEYGA